MKFLHVLSNNGPETAMSNSNRKIKETVSFAVFYRLYLFVELISGATSRSSSLYTFNRSGALTAKVIGEA